METQNVTELIRKEFLLRCQKNESYSLRAFARHLNVDHSLLAKIIRGQKDLSKKMAFQVGEKLGMTSSEVLKVIENSQKIVDSQLIEEDIFNMISDWIHFAALELIKIEGFSYSPKLIAKTFGIPIIEVKLAFERLVRLGFIEISDKKVTLKKSNNNWFNHERTSEARRIMQKQFLKKAIDAVDTVDFKNRVNSSLTIALDPKVIPKFKKHIQAFVDESDRLSEKSLNKKEVYQLCVAFYPLTNIENT